MIRLIVNRWRESHPARRAELELCAKNNNDNPHIGVVAVDAQQRVTYDALIRAANERITSSDDISIIANADIYFDDTVVLFAALDLHEVYALSRYDLRTDGTSIMNPALGIDTWVFRGRIRGVRADFPIGSWATDVRFNAEILLAGYRLLNPARTIRSYHVHTSGIRNYRSRSEYPGPEATITPHVLHHRRGGLLDILICTLYSRRELFEALYAKLHGQIVRAGVVGRVGIRYMCDQKQMTVGEKRNRLIAESGAEYICFIDDDDDVSDDYVTVIVNALESRPDCVSLLGVMTVRGKGERVFVHSIEYDSYFEKAGKLFRPVNHLNPVRRSAALRIEFLKKSCGEDTDWAMSMHRSGLLSTEVVVNKPYYYYRFDPEKTETQR